MAPNEKNLKSLTFRFLISTCQLSLKIDTVTYNLSFGSGSWQNGETKKPGPSLLAGALVNYSGLLPFRVAGSYAWKDNNTLELNLRYIESPHTETFICRFDRNRIAVDVMNSQDFGTRKITVTGEMKNK
jgi:hypothetical protein